MPRSLATRRLSEEMFNIQRDTPAFHRASVSFKRLGAMRRTAPEGKEGDVGTPPAAISYRPRTRVQESRVASRTSFHA